ncbi:tryptophan synthase [Aspergillus undulatus]|uniref:tryptophan synthase n=1 Tax=Aspergillus undulatus TaxID=1810928 RepID=UPI003CCE2BCA
MPVPVIFHSHSRTRPCSARWKRLKKDKHIPCRSPEEEYLNALNNSLNLNLTNTLHDSVRFRHRIIIASVDAPARFGQFGGQFAPELQMDCLLNLPGIFHSIVSEDTFWDTFFACPLTRPSPLHLARNLTQAVGGANIWLKREDLNPFGNYQTRNIIGQVLFAHRIGKKEIIMGCGFAGHGLVCATKCARMGMKCTIFMGVSDVTAQRDAVEKMKRLGATVVAAQNPSSCSITNSNGALRAATNEALRFALTRLDSAYHIGSGTVGPHPLPTIARTFQSLLGQEIRGSFPRLTGKEGKRPDALISHTGSSGSAALGMFAPFIDDQNVRRIAVEAADAAPLAHGSLGVMYGCKTLLLQDDNGQILPSPSNPPAPDMNFPCAGPELAHWKDIGRLETVTATNEEGLRGLTLLRETEGIVAGLATGYAVLETVRVARELGAGKDVVLLVSG